MSAAQTDPVPAAAAAPTPGALRQWFDARSLFAQTAIVVIAATLPLATLLAWWLGPGGVNLVQGLLMGAALAWAACAVLVHRQSMALRQINLASRALARDDVGVDNIPLLPISADLQQLSAHLRRMVKMARQRRRALQERNSVLDQHLQRRTHELSTLQDLSVGLAAKSEVHELVDEALGALEQTLDYASASVWSRHGGVASAPVVLMGYRASDVEVSETPGDSMLGMRLSRPNVQRYEQIEREREPIIDNDARQSLLSWLWAMITDDARSSALYRSTRAWMGVPLKFHDHVMGVLRVDHQTPGYFTPERIRLLIAVCSQTALAMRHAELQSQAREVAVIGERNRIARDLHDAVSQTLFAASVLAGTLASTAARSADPSSAPLQQQARTLERLTRAALAEMRLLMYELRPDALEQTPLSELLQLVIEALASRGDIEVESSLAAHDDLTPAQRLQLYRIAQEALSNIGKHSAATHAVLHWHCSLGPHGTRQASLRIADDGRGFDTTQARPGHLGLGNMAARAAEIGARFSLTSGPEEGTEIKVELP